jgi:hypothetical protein
MEATMAKKAEAEAYFEERLRRLPKMDLAEEYHTAHGKFVALQVMEETLARAFDKKLEAARKEARLYGEEVRRREKALDAMSDRDLVEAWVSSVDYEALYQELKCRGVRFFTIELCNSPDDVYPEIGIQVERDKAVEGNGHAEG